MPKFFVDGSSGDVSFYEDTGTTAELFWDASEEALGIGTTTPAVKLDIDGTDAIRLPVGTDAQRPTGAAGQIRFNSDSDEFEGYDGTAWGALGGGKVLQVVQSVVSTQQSTTSQTYVDVTGLSATITPTSASSKILVFVTPNFHVSTDGYGYPIYYLDLLRTSTVIFRKRNYNYAERAPNSYFEIAGDGNMIYLDSPNTTSATTYKVQTKVTYSSGTVTLVYQKDSNTQSSITLMEIAA